MDYGVEPLSPKVYLVAVAVWPAFAGAGLGLGLGWRRRLVMALCSADQNADVHLVLDDYWILCAGLGDYCIGVIALTQVIPYANDQAQVGLVLEYGVLEIVSNPLLISNGNVSLCGYVIMSQDGDGVELILSGLTAVSPSGIALGNEIASSESQSQVSGILFHVETVMAGGELVITLDNGIITDG